MKPTAGTVDAGNRQHHCFGQDCVSGILHGRYQAKRVRFVGVVGNCYQKDIRLTCTAKTPVRDVAPVPNAQPKTIL